MTPPRGIDPADNSIRRRIPVVVAAVLVGALVACVPTGERPELVDDTGSAAGGSPDLSQIECPVAGDQFEGFEVRPVALIDPDGYLVQCVLVADTPALRKRGFSGVPDPGGHAGMIFAFPEDTSGSFWMGNTHMPLTIAFIDSSGAQVAALDMEPCPEAVDCPSYFPDAPYRWALEVPQGQLDQFGLTDAAAFDPGTLPPATE